MLFKRYIYRSINCISNLFFPVILLFDWIDRNNILKMTTAQAITRLVNCI